MLFSKILAQEFLKNIRQYFDLCKPFYINFYSKFTSKLD